MAEDALTVHLVRHGSHGHLGRTLSGRTPAISLADTGRVEARAVARWFAGETLAALYSSPLERARETAEPLSEATGLPVAISDALNEIDCGEWTGLSFEALHADERWHVWNRERATSCPPGGEPMSTVQIRALDELERWRTRHSGATVAAVTHSDVVKAVICGVLGLSLDRYHAFEIEPASITTIILWEGGGKVVAMNERPPRDKPSGIAA